MSNMLTKTLTACAYADNRSAAVPPCGGPIAFVWRGHWTRENRERLGADAYFCETHGQWLAKLNPFHGIKRVG